MAKRIPEDKLDVAIGKLTEIRGTGDEERARKTPACPKCGGARVVRNGHQSGKQQYLRKECGGSFAETTNSAMSRSHATETVRKSVISDTINGVSIDETAVALDLRHETVFNMRHKILRCLERSANGNTKPLKGVCEADGTRVPESVKGSKMPDDCRREARRHGAVASKRGISSECVCACAAAGRGGKAFATASNRANPSKDELLRVFGGRVAPDTPLPCDGAKNYGVLSENGKRVVAVAKDGLNSINAVNGFHSLIKERNRAARGFATRYLNRYNALFETVFRAPETIESL